MKTRLVLGAAAVLAALWAATAVWSQEEMQFVENRVFAAPQRPPAVFQHDEHNETAVIDDCSQCHHVYDEQGELMEDESSEDQACSECHGPSSVDGRPRLMNAFHLNCKGCHQQQKKGPLMCGECHVRR